ncbi:MAG: M20 family metallopeptidase [Saprospiraceae bacterium]
MNNLLEEFHYQAGQLLPELISIRHKLHQYPELSFQEKETSSFIGSVLESWGIPFQSGLAGYGLTGVLNGGATGNGLVALRADMDALPIHEETGLDFSSRNSGVMHACGHDVHMTCLLGAIRLLELMKSKWGGRVQFIFQPGEEKLPGGASLMLAEGIFHSELPQVIIGQHVQPGMKVGEVGLCPGQAMASCDELYISITGRGGHAAMPHLANNPITAGSTLVHRIQELLPAINEENIPSLISIGKFNTVGGATNVIPEIVHLEGTFRCMDEGLREKAHKGLQALCNELAAEFDAKVHLNLVKGYPCLHNNLKASEVFFELAKSYPGIETVSELPPRMTSEDFAFYSQIVPAVFYRLGTGFSSNVHTAQFIVNEDAVAIGSGLMAALACRFLLNV